MIIIYKGSILSLYLSLSTILLFLRFTIQMNIDADFLDMLELPLAVYLNEQGLHRAQAVRVVVLAQEQEVRTYDMASV